MTHPTPTKQTVKNLIKLEIAMYSSAYKDGYTVDLDDTVDSITKIVSQEIEEVIITQEKREELFFDKYKKLGITSIYYAMSADEKRRFEIYKDIRTKLQQKGLLEEEKHG